MAVIPGNARKMAFVAAGVGLVTIIMAAVLALSNRKDDETDATILADANNDETDATVMSAEARAVTAEGDAAVGNSATAVAPQYSKENIEAYNRSAVENELTEAEELKRAEMQERVYRMMEAGVVEKTVLWSQLDDPDVKAARQALLARHKSRWLSAEAYGERLLLPNPLPDSPLDDQGAEQPGEEGGHSGAVSVAAGGLPAGDLSRVDDHPRPSVEVIDTEVILIRDLLTLEEQTRLMQYITENDKTPTDERRAMVPAPKTLILGEDGPSIKYGFDDSSVVSCMVKKGGEVLRTEQLNVIGGRTGPTGSQGFDVCAYTALSMATIRYEAPDGRFPPHIDHCNNSFVFLASLGCTANFMVKAPSMPSQRRFKFRSGDLLVFNASSEAAVVHSVESIDEGSSQVGELMGRKFPVLKNHRYGVQCRMYFGAD